MSTILIPLLCVVWKGIVFSGAEETYQVPIKSVAKDPFEAIYQYPMEGNGFKMNEDGTRVFWPANEKIYSKFYLNMAYDKEILFGISQQIFQESVRAAVPGASMSANDHLGFVKVVGPWDDGTSDNIEDRNGYPPIDLWPLEQRLLNQKMKVGLTFQWWQLANVSALFLGQGMNPAQIMANMQYAHYNAESEKLEQKLLAEMDTFSSGLSHTDYQQFDKSASMCFHINTAGSQLTEEDGTSGWWLPLKQNLFAWRSMGFQQPLTAVRVTAGLISLTTDESGNLNVVFKGTQLYRNEIDGLDYINNELDMAPPNALPPFNLPDLRAPVKHLTMGPEAAIIRAQYQALPNDPNLPWVDRNELCPEEAFESRFEQVKGACGYPFNPTKICVGAYIEFYPCFNYYLRPSKKHNHGMDSIVEFATLLHAISELHPSYWKELARDQPWDEEFAQAMDLLGIGI